MAFNSFYIFFYQNYMLIAFRTDDLAWMKYVNKFNYLH